MSRHDFLVLLGQRLKKLRKTAGLTRKEVGKKLNMPTQQVYRYEIARNQVSVLQLKAFAKLYSVSIDELLKEE